MIARRMSKLDSSGIRKVFDLAAKLKNPVNLSIGQPDFDVPDEVKQAGIDAIHAGANRYTVTQGIAELRTAILEKLRQERGVEPEGIVITSGVSGALMLAFLVLVEPGDEVIIPDPYFVMYKHLVNLTGGTPRFVDTYPDFRFTRERIEPHVTPRTKILVLNSPANPTGAICNKADLEGIAQLAAERDLLVISDEIYQHFSYDEPHQSIARLHKKTLLVDGFSKSHAMTGWRLGFAAGPADILNQMAMLQQYSFVCAPSFAQVAGLKALQTDTKPYAEAYRRKRDLIYNGL
ncbi:MAG: aminotransferase class I/II-fold pyridoxal phosphate-dependent enzyme, partial [Planctomycetes bacterium]|nr:aminotransferase class I/II-fold pyridoxal phosphate-dependent enzyme [Planctomycetota bacterium]